MRGSLNGKRKAFNSNLLGIRLKKFSTADFSILVMQNNRSEFTLIIPRIKYRRPMTVEVYYSHTTSEI